MENIMNIETLKSLHPNLGVAVKHNEFGLLIVLTGKGAKAVANRLATENYRNGFVNT